MVATTHLVGSSRTPASNRDHPPPTMPNRLSFRVDLLDVQPPIWRSFDLVGNPCLGELQNTTQLPIFCRSRLLCSMY